MHLQFIQNSFLVKIHCRVRRKELFMRGEKDENQHGIGLCANLYSICRCRCFPCLAVRPSGPIGFSGIQAQLQGSADALLENRSNIRFNSIPHRSSQNIRYNSLTGEFTLSGNRIYYVSWWVAVDGTDYTSSAEFAVVRNNSLISVSSSPQVTCQLSGTALFTSGSAPELISLKNISGNTIKYAPTSVQANLVILDLTL